MEQVVLVIHLLIALALVGVILLQKSDGGALGGLGGGMSGGGASFGGLFTARGGASFLTRTTAILATSFIATSLLLAILATGGDEGSSIFEDMPVEQPAAPEADAPAAPADEPSEPQAPIAD
ncbi:MAG: preprotein translocase subunit SecG [Alphaproteobacteria bacterium]